MSGWTSPNSSGYSAKDMMRMQQEAVERVREMQERSRRVLEESVYPDFVKKPEPKRQEEPEQRRHGAAGAPAEHSGHTRQAGTASGFFSPSMPEQKTQPLPHQPIPHPQEPQGPTKQPGLFGSLAGSLGGLLGGGGTGPISRVLDALNIDNDKIIVLMLLLILINNNADKKLILALGYILL